MATSGKQHHGWKEMWDTREAALKSVLGETDGKVFHSYIPFHLGGQADVICFSTHIVGKVAATCELLGEEGQVRNELGTYELMIAHRDDSNWGPNIISRLARYTCDALLEPGHTMEISSAAPKGSTIAGLLFCEYARFVFQDQPAGLLLCLGLTADELEQCKSGGRDDVMAALKSKGVYPYTDLVRASTLR